MSLEAHKSLNAGVFIGRFQPFHMGHLSCIHQILQKEDRVVIVVGGKNKSPDINDPFTWLQRAEMIANTLREADIPCYRFIITGVEDRLYNDTLWIKSVEQQVSEVLAEIIEPSTKKFPIKVTLHGFEKDISSYYLNMFQRWSFSALRPFRADEGLPLSATDIRSKFFGGGPALLASELPKTILEYLGLEFYKTDDYKRLRSEFAAIELYKSMLGSSPFPPTFVTTDCVVIKSGHVLLVKRKNPPGRGISALPGGFLNQNERIEDGALRELKEETKIALPKAVLRGHITGTKVYDHPRRSVRGRTITHAFLIDLGAGDLPFVKGSDYAEHAWWQPLSALNRAELFEDHFDIIEDLVARL